MTHPPHHLLAVARQRAPVMTEGERAPVSCTKKWQNSKMKVHQTTSNMPRILAICLIVGALAFVQNAAAQSIMNGCAVGQSIPYPAPVAVGTAVDLPATAYLDNMACSFILNLPSSDPPAFDGILTFSKFQTELNWDFVEVYNGCDPSRPRTVNASASPCSLITDFPFQLMRRSGVFRCFSAASSIAVRSTPTLFCRFPPDGSDVPFTITSSTSSVLILFRTDASIRSQGFSASFAVKSSGSFGPFPNPTPLTPENTITLGADGKPASPRPYPFDVSGHFAACFFSSCII